MNLKTIFFLVAIFSYSGIYAQNNIDTLQTDSGQVLIQPVLHGSLILNFNNITIFVDPYGGADLYKDSNAPNIILITDIHGDHLHQKTLDSIDTSNAVFIVPQAVADKLPEKYNGQLAIVHNGQGIHRLGFFIQAIPMYNLPDDENSRHPKGRGNGYVLTVGGKSIYISGDTEDIPEMRALQNIDMAFVCMNLPYTMDINQAADAVLEFQPKVVYPYHYRGKGGLSDVTTFKKLIDTGNKNIEVRLSNWYSVN